MIYSEMHMRIISHDFVHAKHIHGRKKRQPQNEIRERVFLHMQYYTHRCKIICVGINSDHLQRRRWRSKMVIGRDAMQNAPAAKIIASATWWLATDI